MSKYKIGAKFWAIILSNYTTEELQRYDALDSWADTYYYAIHC
jgi:hypothetical protein